MNSPVPHYCKVLHDTSRPVASQNVGMNRSLLNFHYSVYEVTYLPVLMSSTKTTSRLVILWDEDHDTRVFSVVECLAESGLLPYVAVIGERKAAVTIILNKNVKKVLKGLKPVSNSWGDVDLSEFSKKINLKVQEEHEDEWNTEFYTDISLFHYSYKDNDLVVAKYLDLLNDIWDLQLETFTK